MNVTIFYSSPVHLAKKKYKSEVLVRKEEQNLIEIERQNYYHVFFAFGYMEMNRMRHTGRWQTQKVVYVIHTRADRNGDSMVDLCISQYLNI